MNEREKLIEENGRLADILAKEEGDHDQTREELLNVKQDLKDAKNKIDDLVDDMNEIYKIANKY